MQKPYYKYILYVKVLLRMLKRSIFLSALKGILFFLMFFIPCALLHAHAGSVLEKIAGEYIVDIDFASSAMSIYARQPLWFNVRLLSNNSERNPVPISNVNVEIAHNNKQVFEANIIKEPQRASGFTYTFPEDGNYTLHATFYQSGKEIIDQSFDFPVSQEKNSAQNAGFSLKMLFSKEGFIGIFIGLLLGRLISNFI